MNISYGGESNKQQKSNLMKDNPVAKHASAMNMYDKSGSPTEFNEGLKKASKDGKLDKNLEFKAKVDASDINMNKPKGKKQPLNNRKVKKAAKTQAQIDKIRNSFGTKDADVSGRFDRKRKKMDKTVSQLEKKGINVDFDTTSAEGEGKSRKTTKKTSYVSGKNQPLNNKNKLTKAQQEYLDRTNKKMRENSAKGKKLFGDRKDAKAVAYGGDGNQPTKMYKKH